MRAKEIFSRIPVPAQVKLVYARLTLNRLTTLYFVLAIVHCVLQVVLQLAAHAINVNARHLVTHILEQAKLTMDKFAIVENKRRAHPTRGTDLTLTLCRGIPGQFGFTGKDVCDVLWSQSRGLVNDTVEDFLSPSSESDNNPSSDSEDNTTTSPLPVQAPTSSASVSASASSTPLSSSSSTRTSVAFIPSTLPFAIAPSPVSSTPTSTSTSASTSTSTSILTSTSTTRRTITSLFISTTTTSFATSTSSPPDSPASPTSTFLSPTGLALPTGVENLVKPPKSPASAGSDDSDSDKERIPARQLRKRALKQRSAATEKREGARKVFDREKLRPLALSPRSQPRTPAQSPSVDIDESHPDLKAHIRRARVAPITNSLLRRTREGLNVEYAPTAPRTVDPKRFVSHRSRRSKRSKALSARSSFDSDQRDVKITPIWRFEVDSDAEKKNQQTGNLRSRRSKRSKALSARSSFDSDQRDVKITPIWRFEVDSDAEKKNQQTGNLGGNSTMPMSSNQGKPILVSVKISGLVGPGMGDQQILAGNNTAAFGDVELSPGCVLALSWPAQVLRDFAREDLAMIGFQAWLFGMTIVAILNESVPHMVAGLFTQALSTGWSAFQMARSVSFRAQYGETIVRGACSGIDVLPEYFSHRTTDEIPIVVLNAIFLVTLTILSWRMCKVYGWQTFKRIGASRVMNRAYRLVLAFSIHLQCAVYFFVTSIALWVDELLNGSIACFAEHQAVYKGIFIASILLLLPWLILGWIGVRRENKHMMHGFLVISLLFITAWAAMFASDVYRWTFATWPFFAAMTVTSFMVLVATTGLAIVCRYNFKKGLALFLQSQQVLPGAEFTDAMPDPEKVVFPAQRTGEELPTFSVAFGRGGVPQPPSQMFPAKPAATLSRSSSLNSNPPAGYSVNPYATNASDFWGEGNVTRSTSAHSKSSTSSVPTNRTTEATSIDDAPRYTPEDSFASQSSSIRRELPQWEEVRRSQLPFHFDLQPPRMSIQPQPQIQAQPDRTSIYSSGTTETGSNQVEILRDGRWQKVDARELHRASILSGVTHTSGFSGASWAPGDDSGPLPSRAPLPPLPAYRAQPSPPVAPRPFIGLPGKNVKPHITSSGRVTQQFSPPQATGVLGGSAVPAGW
ncbi:unnamed protein product [Rhizoctonia solani]|uniref:Transmembrane protein n=1 Tax=Rhizoctonia solani TaxID=456999 RepID=A0A8H3HK73_9AGAM|nr:unnamed protein product [Rhizoctonia solani]